jgi:hypothetical protein
MLFLLRGAQALGSKVRVGLVTNGDEWVLVHVAPNETATYVTWSSELFFDEPLTFRAFVSVLGQKRLFGVPDPETLEALFEESSKNQHDVTDQLGTQVRRAVEILVQTIDRLDRDRGRVLLKGIADATLYESAVTVMMRLVFLFAAEEKKLLLLGNPLYDENYAVSTLHDQLQATADANGEEVLERRHDAWSRLLASFRAVFGGIEHTDLRLPAYGGSLFDPDRFPFLEGRTPGTSWRDAAQFAASPLAVDNRTVLHLLRALQRLEIRVPGGGPAESRRLSFRALDIEQIGHVYEGLLDHTAKRAKGLTLSLEGKNEPEIALEDLEAHREKDKAGLAEWLAGETGRSAPAIERALKYELPKEDERAWLAVCDSQRPTYDRVLPWAGLVRHDSHKKPVVIPEGAVYVTEGSDRRSTGTHYTPRSLTEPIVQHTLDPLVYDGPSDGKPREDWVLKSPKEVLALRVCDLAMGSGAFLVQTCRYLAMKLVEGWGRAEEAANAKGQLVLAPDGELSKGRPGETLVPREPEERLVLARRYVADRCLYGVDINPMAVEMAKLSLWLVTLQKDRPFSFVDHALRAGDSLLGVTSEEQLLYFHLDSVRGKEIHNNLLELAKKMKAALARSREMREKLESFTVRDISDSMRKEWLLGQANAATEDLRAIGDLLLGAALATAGKKADALDEALLDLSPSLANLFDAPVDSRAKKRGEARVRAEGLLNERREDQHARRRPFHWAIEFPEVMQRGGFDAIVGNPPFRGGKLITGDLGVDYREHLVAQIGEGRKGNADLCAYFLLRVATLLAANGGFGLLTTNTIAQGDTREVALDALTNDGFSITRAVPSQKWPGSANLEVSHLWIRRSGWRGECVLNGARVSRIGAQLRPVGRSSGNPHALVANEEKAFIGSYVLGMGFTLEPEEAKVLITSDRKNRDVVFPYLNGQDLNSSADQSASRWVINFKNWPLDRKTAPDGYTGPVAADYPDCLSIVRRMVKPERDKLGLKGDSSARGYARLWWQFGRRGDRLYAAIDGFERVLVTTQTSRTQMPALIPNRSVIAHKVVAFGSEAPSWLAILSSNVHRDWVLQQGSTMRTDAVYTPSDCFTNFPFPESSGRTWQALDAVGTKYDDHRQEMMLANQEGLTATYNRFHDPDEKSAAIKKLRALHVEMDEAVKHAYGWDDLPLDHGFHETKQGLRYTIGDAARVEVLDRLLALNQERYAEEVKAGLHPDAKAKAATKAAAKARAPAGPVKKRGKKANAGQAGLFGAGDEE